MHVPDGFLSPRVAVTAATLSAAAVALAVRQTRATLPPRKVPLMGLAAAFVFAAQMLNFPVAAGTSGHLVGGVLCSVLLGPAAAIVVLTCVLIVQCLVFADGGLLALGANVFNMAVVCSVGGYAVYRLAAMFLPRTDRGRLTAVAFAAWAATVAASVVCAGELALSGTVSWRAALPAMAGVHMLIGLGEAAITAAVLYGITRARPELLRPDATPRAAYPELLAYGALIILGLAAFVAPLACPWPDGLERVADTLGFAGRSHTNAAPLPDYSTPGISSAAIATGVAGVIGAAVTFGLAILLARVLAPTRRDADEPTG